MNIDLGAQAPLSMAQSMKQAYMNSITNTFGPRGGGDLNTSMNGEGADDDKEKAKKIKIPFYELNQEER